MPEKYNSGLNTETYPVDINIFIKKTDFVMYSNQWFFTYSTLHVTFSKYEYSIDKQAAYFLYREAEKHFFWL